MPIDSRPIREKARRDYDKVIADLEQARKDIERFEKHDQPSFSRWLNRQFGALLTELRETTEKLQTHRELLFEIDSEAFAFNCSHVRAYERVMWRRAHPEPEPDPAAEAAQGKPGPDHDGEPGADEFEQFFSEIEDEFEKLFGENAGNGEPPSEPNSAAHSTAARLKELYRAVVRHLHPDMHRTVSAQRLEWWHQAQAAYESGDVEQLQVILTLCEIEEKGTTAATSVSLLMRITRQFKGTLRTLKAQLMRYRGEPAWNFTNIRDHTALSTRTERSLRQELAELQQALGAIESQIAVWARQAQMTRRRSVRRRPAGHPEFIF
jgi:hypothetical protein